MKGQITKQIVFVCIVVSLTSSCTSITNLFPKEPRPFQKRAFDSEQWKNGDYQTRGEMAENLRLLIEKPDQGWKKSPEEVRQILGKPDVVTEAECCEVGRGHSPHTAELWLYYIEIEKEYYMPQKEAEAERTMVSRAFKLYFPKGDSAGFRTVIGDRTGDHSILMPVVGRDYQKNKMCGVENLS
jgi:hypothetical protein